MILLNEHQLEVMRLTYPGFRKLESEARQVKAEAQKYREKVGYVPTEESRVAN